MCLNTTATQINREDFQNIYNKVVTAIIILCDSRRQCDEFVQRLCKPAVNAEAENIELRRHFHLTPRSRLYQWLSTHWQPTIDDTEHPIAPPASEGFSREPRCDRAGSSLQFTLLSVRNRFTGEVDEELNIPTPKLFAARVQSIIIGQDLKLQEYEADNRIAEVPSEGRFLLGLPAEEIEALHCQVSYAPPTIGQSGKWILTLLPASEEIICDSHKMNCYKLRLFRKVGYDSYNKEYVTVNTPQVQLGNGDQLQVGQALLRCEISE
jgi:hypothetical protein